MGSQRSITTLLLSVVEQGWTLATPSRMTDTTPLIVGAVGARRSPRNAKKMRRFQGVRAALSQGV